MTEPADIPRLIEVAFPLREASLDSLHEKSAGRNGHISTLHIWPARRPLAASRAALVATLLPDPANDADRERMLERLAGKLVTPITKAKDESGRTVEVAKQQTEGGILHWGRESNADLGYFKDLIRKTYGGRPPRVMDPFSGGGAIPLEAMRLGCEVTAIDINRVAWFVLKCTLDFPQQLAGKKRPLPPFAKDLPEFVEQLSTGQGKRAKGTRGKGPKQDEFFASADADLAWHARAWAHWVLREAETRLEKFYPVIKGKPSLAYLWARTVVCKNCRTRIPLIKTKWLCKTKDNSKRVLLKLDVDGKDIIYGVQSNVPLPKTLGAQRREHDRKLGLGTMSDSGVTCPKETCRITMSMEDIRVEAMAGRLDYSLMAVVVEGKDGKEYRPPSSEEIDALALVPKSVAATFKEIPHGLPDEPLPGKEALGIRVPLYGFTKWSSLFTPRQLLSIGTFVAATRAAHAEMGRLGYPPEWRKALTSYLALVNERLTNQSSTIARWNKGGQKIEGTFARFALPMVWDFAEVNPLASTSGCYRNAIDFIVQVIDHLLVAEDGCPSARVLRQSAIEGLQQKVDVVVTDPPYYDAIPYSDLMDFFYVWLRRTLSGLDPEFDEVFSTPLNPKWDHAANDGELIDDSSRFEGSKARSKQNYEEGMARAFKTCHDALTDDGRLVIVFAHKQPDAWETLVGAIIRAGFVVDGSWPIQTERSARTRSLSSAALSSSVWLVCKKRPDAARPGWDNRVLEDMRERIYTRLKSFWDAGIRGPDFVWAATGPAMEAYSRHPVVKKANEPGQVMGVSEFLRQVRRIVVDYVVGRVLSRDGAETVSGLDDVTTYYLLHRNDFGFGDAPAGACILYAVSCGLSDDDVTDTYDLLAKTGAKGGADDDDDDDEEDSAEPSEGAGSKMKLKSWEQRKRKSLGTDGDGRPAPMIDQVHKLMHLWRAGDVNKVDEYLDSRALKKSQLFHHLLQALIELAPAGEDERALLESISNHLASKPAAEDKQLGMFSS